jgi:cell division protein FtsW
MVFGASFFLGEERFGDPYAMALRQTSFLTLAVVLGLAISRVPPTVLRSFAYPALALVLVLLALVLVPGIGLMRGGARRWLPLGPIAFEPSELLKPALVLYLAHSLARKGDKLSSFGFGVLPHLLVALVPMVLLLLEPDFGATAVVALLTGAMLFVAGARPSHLLTLGAGAGAVGFALVYSSDYRWKRVMGFLDPWDDPLGKGFQLVQSFLAFGSGGVTGVGLGHGRQKLFYLPEGHTDFIFALIGEEMGFLGGSLVLLGFAIVALRGFRLATRAHDAFTSHLAFGLTFVIVVQAALNMAVVTGCLPTKGMPLPLLSYGGSSLVTTVGMIAVLLGISRQVR